YIYVNLRISLFYMIILECLLYCLFNKTLSSLEENLVTPPTGSIAIFFLLPRMRLPYRRSRYFLPHKAVTFTVILGNYLSFQPVSPRLVLLQTLLLLVGSRTNRKSTRLNSSHVSISYAVFCLQKKMTT